MVGRAREGAQSGAESTTGPLRSASTTGASVAATSMSVGPTSVLPLPLPELLPSSPATQNTSQTFFLFMCIKCQWVCAADDDGEHGVLSKT